MISINGSINCTKGSCLYLDALLVKYYDPDVDPDYAYHSTSVSQDGIFLDEIDSPTGFYILIKLFVVNRDGSETFVVSEQFEVFPELNPVFNYDESQYSYASNIEVATNGTVTPVSSPCNSLDKLLVKFFDGYAAAGSGSFATAYLDSSGNYNKQLTLPTRSVIAKLYVVNRDGSETLVESKTTYYETGHLEINFSYNELNFSYAQPLIAITGLVTPAQVPCNSLDKLKVYYLDGYDPSPGAFANHLVGADGTFSGSIQATSRSVIAKLYVVNTDTTETLVESKTFYCPDNDETINFNYDESLFSYSNLNNNNMTIHFKGIVKKTDTGFFKCADFGGLSIKVNEVGFGSPVEIASIAITNKGTFSQNVATEAKALTVSLYYDDQGVLKLVQTFDINCPGDIVELEFNFNSASFGSDVFTKITEGLSDYVVAGSNFSSLDDILNLDDEELYKLSCMGCVSEGAILQMKATYQLWQSCTSYFTGLTLGLDYTDAQTAIGQFTATGFESSARALIFALTRNRPSENIGQLFTFSYTQLQIILNDAVTANVLSASLNTNAYLTMLIGCRDAVLLNANNDGYYFEAKIIHLSGNGTAGYGNTYAAKSNLLSLTLNAGGLSALPAATAGLSFAMPVLVFGNHLFNYAPLMNHAITQLGVTSGGTYFNPNYFNIALAGPSQWNTWVAAAGYPSSYNSAGSYASAVYHHIGNSQPSGRQAYNLTATGSPFTTNTYLTTNYNGNTLRTILVNNPGFNINNQSVGTFNFSGSPSAAHLGQLTRFQRVIRMTGEISGLKGAGKLLEGEKNTSLHVTQMGRENFIKYITNGTGISAEHASNMYCNAQAVYDSVNSSVVHYQTYESEDSFMPDALKDNNLTLPPFTLPSGLPNLKTLFGTQDSCECSSCQSVYSAGAYLSDLLNWLNKDVVNKNQAGNIINGGLDALKKSGNLDTVTNTAFPYKNRREDITYVDLNCKNTNTPIPYIDIVNELLCLNLRTNDILSATLTADPPIYTEFELLQTVKTEEEVLAEPEHRFPAEEALLGNYFYPWVLPYNVPYSEAVSYLKGMGKPYHELIRDFSKAADQYATYPWAYAYLGLNKSEADLITTDNSGVGSFWSVYWGISGAPATVGPVLSAANLNMYELEEVLSAYYITKSNTKVLLKAPATDPCAVNDYTFNTTTGAAFDLAVADRFMRLLRLKRKTNLSIWELDMAIKNLSPSAGIDQAFLHKLAASIAFTEKYNISFTELLVWFGDNSYLATFNAANKSDYYKSKFESQLLPLASFNFFAAASSTAISSITTVQKQILANTFGVSLATVEAIFSLNPFTGSNLTTANLAKLEAMCLFCKKFEIAPADLSPSLTLFGNPFSSANSSVVIKTAWDFAMLKARYDELGVSLSTLVNLMEGTGAYSTASLDAAAEQVWLTLEAAYKKAVSENPSKTFSTTTPYSTNHATNAAADLAFFKDIVADNLNAAFGLYLADTKAIINNYNATWFEDFVKNPEGLGGSGNVRSWTNKKATFVPVYRLLNRIVILKDLFGLKDETIAKAINIEISTTLNAPGNPFYWLSSDYTQLTTALIKDLIWVHESVKLAEKLGLSQPAFYNLADDYFDNFSGNNGYSTTSFAKIDAMYLSLGEASTLKELSIHEFKEIFVRARSISIAQDIVSLMARFETIESVSSAVNIKAADSWSWIWQAGWENVTSAPTFTLELINTTTNKHKDMRRAFQSKFQTFSAWSEAIVPTQNDLRAKMRDALVALYIRLGGFTSEYDIYSYFLLDTQMAPCMKISRIVAAISSAQLMIHRALLNIEPGITMSDANKKEWEWRKNYRVWEANRKVFLYPENWIDPTLRKNKTVLFKEAEELLQQDEINDRNSEIALAGYLTGLNEVAHLDVRAFYVEKPDFEPPRDQTPPELRVDNYQYSEDETLHVFARTWNAPYTYYYRTFANEVWTGWEKLDVEVDSDHLIPMFFNRKLYLFFPMFIEKHWYNNPQNKYYEISMCYTKLDFGKWSQKKILNGKLYCGPIAYHTLGNSEALLDQLVLGHGMGSSVNMGNDVYQSPSAPHWGKFSYVSMNKEDFYFWAQNKSDGDLVIHCRRALNKKKSDAVQDTYTEFGYEWGFRVSACDERVTIVPPEVAEDTRKPIFLGRPFMTIPHYQQMRTRRDIEGINYLPFYKAMYVKEEVNYPGSSERILFTGVDGKYVLTYPQQYKHNRTPQPFFYRDERRGFFIRYYPDTNTFKVLGNDHVFACTVLAALNSKGIEGLYNPGSGDPLKRQEMPNQTFDFDTIYKPTMWVEEPKPANEFDFSLSGPYSIYNWEIFFHTTSLVARQLKQNNKYAEAIRWLNFVFDPADPDKAGYSDLRYWQIKPFMQHVSQQTIRNMIRLLSTNPTTADDIALKKQYEAQINIWRKNPFDPHAIAAMRPRAYMLWTVMEYVNTLSDWGDYLFRQDTMESINEAINLYMIASEILGARPKRTKRLTTNDRNFKEIAGSMSAFSNILVAFEAFENNITALDLHDTHGATWGTGNSQMADSNVVCAYSPGVSTVPDLLFCIPENPKLIEMWDRVEDRLFKIRHCMNIDGKVRQLALFSPPIDPAMLVQAAAAGLSIADALADLAAPMPHYRFSYLLQKANEFNNEVKALGSQLLGLIEKKDAEELSLFRQVHEQNILKAARALKQMAIDEAKQSLSTLEYSKNLIQIRLEDYENRQFINAKELTAQEFTRKSEDLGIREQQVRLLAGLLGLIPEFYVGTNPVKYIGGSKISALAGAGANVLGIYSTVNRNKASMSLTYAGYDRRQEDWELQKKTAREELLQVDRQLLGAKIRIAVAEKELDNHDFQVEQSEEMYDWLKNKYTNGKLYSWMSGQVKAIYKQMFNLAYDMAKRAQTCMDYELGKTTGSNIIQYGQWDGSKSGFLAGERLALQLKQLETEYIKNNTRELEMSKNISLALLDPKALEDLIVTGACVIKLPELLFDLDHPGQYKRRIKSVSISIPCVAGPNTNINAILSLTSHNVRQSNQLGSAAPLGFNSVPIESIATSSSQNDSGVFELNFKDERYLPFEGKGAVSEWTLNLTQIERTASSKEKIRLFDFSSISDVVIHMKYTAKYDGGYAGILKTYINSNITTLASTVNANGGLSYIFSLKHDMPNEWHAFKQSGNTDFKVEKSRLPYFVQALDPKVSDLRFIVMPSIALTGTQDLTLSSSVITPALNNVALSVYTCAPDVIKPYQGTYALSNVSLSTVFNIKEANTVKANVSDIIIIAKLNAS